MKIIPPIAVDILGIVTLLPFIAFGLHLRLMNPALTETQLFLNYWPVWLLFVVFGVLWGRLRYRVTR